MAYRRTAIRQFSIANAAYRNANITFSKVNPTTLEATGIPAVLYQEPSGTTTAPNPYTLDSEGKFIAPVYIEEPVIAIVNTSAVGSHQTGIINPDSGGWKGDWAADTDYLPGEFVRDGAAGANTGNVYVCVTAHTSDSSWLLDLGNGLWQLAIPVATVTLPGGVTGILDIANGGTGSNSAGGARTALGLGSAATMSSSAFEAAGTAASLIAAAITDTVTDGVTDKAPTQNAVYDALQLRLPTSYLDTDGTLAANSDVKIPTQKAVKTYADQLIAANDAMVFKGVIDCSTNPNYPAADRGHTYRVSVAGKIGGASGVSVEVGDLALCLTDGTASGDQAAVGANWTTIQTNSDGLVVGPASATDGNFPLWDGTTGKLLKNSAFSPSSFQASNVNLTGIAGLTSAADRLPYFTGGGGASALATFTSFARTLLDDADATAARSTIGVFNDIITGGRLTLTTGTPVTQSDVASGSTIYYAPYVDNRISLHDGFGWWTYTFTEPSLALSGLTSGRPYDVFAYSNAGVVTLEFLSWTNDTTRATALTRQDGVLVKSGDTTRRYLGTFYTTGTTTTADTLSTRYLYNEYNQVIKSLYAGITTANYNYNTATWRTADSNTTNGVGRFSWVQGQVKNRVTVIAGRAALNTTNTYHQHGIALNGTTSSELTGTLGGSGLAAICTSTCQTAVAGIVGLNYIQAMEYGGSSGTTTWYSQSSGGGMVGHIMC